MGDGFPPLTGDGPKEPSLLKGPMPKKKKHSVFFSTIYHAFIFLGYTDSKTKVLGETAAFTSSWWDLAIGSAWSWLYN